MIIDPFKKMHNYIELSREISPGGKLDTNIIRNYLQDQNKYDDVIGLTENKINNGLVDVNRITKYFKFNTTTDIKTPSDILRKYEEVQTASSFNSISGILKDIIFKNIDSVDFVTRYYAPEDIKTFNSYFKTDGNE